MRNESHNDCLDRESVNQAIIGVNKDHKWGFRRVCTIQSLWIRMGHSVFRSEWLGRELIPKESGENFCGTNHDDPVEFILFWTLKLLLVYFTIFLYKMQSISQCPLNLHLGPEGPVLLLVSSLILWSSHKALSAQSVEMTASTDLVVGKREKLQFSALIMNWQIHQNLWFI